MKYNALHRGWHLQSRQSNDCLECGLSENRFRWAIEAHEQRVAMNAVALALRRLEARIKRDPNRCPVIVCRQLDSEGFLAWDV
jgi:hypothetical protein